MITITLIRDSNREIIEFWATGHAEYKDKGRASLLGEDIVCAAVSAITQTAVEGLKRYLPERICVKKDKGILHVEINPPLTVDSGAGICESSIILETMLLGLKRIEENYQEHVRVVMA